MDRRSFLKLLTCSGALLTGHSLGLVGCSRKEGFGEHQPRLALLYATCTVNKFYLSPYNRSVTFTPFIGRFAAESAVFMKHQSECGQSGTAYASILTGNQADKHGVFDHPRVMDESNYLITEAFKENGYDTFLCATHPMANYGLAYGQGVQPENNHERYLTGNDDALDEILEKLSIDRDYRVLIVTLFTVTHGLYTFILNEADSSAQTLPGEFIKTGLTVEEFNEHKELYLSFNRSGFSLSFDFPETIRKLGFSQQDLEKFVKAVEYLYKCGIRWLDLLFGSLIAELARRGLLDESLIIFTADHGETLYRDNTFFKFTHGFQLAPEVLTVPLIVRAPRLGIGGQNHFFVTRSTDVFPSVAGLAGVRIPEEKKPDGIDLSPVITGQARPPVLPAFSHTALVADEVAVWPEYRDSLFHRFVVIRCGFTYNSVWFLPLATP